MKEEMAHRVGVINVGSLTTLETLGHTNQRKRMVINLTGLHLIREPLRMSSL
jgi:hypothetical protein